MSKFNELGYELLPNPPYLPGLPPNNYFLFKNMKKFLGCTKNYFQQLELLYSLVGIQKIETFWIEMKGDYAENFN